MKKFVSLLLVLLLALTSAAAVNAEGIRDIFGTENAKGATTAITDNHGIRLSVVDYSYLPNSLVYASHNFYSSETNLKHSLDSNGFPQPVANGEDKAQTSQKLWDTTSRNDLSYVTYKQDNVGSFLLYDSATNTYHIDSWNSNDIAQKVVYNTDSEIFEYEDYFCTADVTAVSPTQGNSEQFLDDSFGDYYAITLRTNFTMPEGGCLTYEHNNTTVTEPMKFEFTGDDLIFVYIDGIRILNGSIQNFSWPYRANGHTPSIDFSTGEVYTMTDKNMGEYTTLYDRFAAYCDEEGMSASEKTAYLNSKFDLVNGNHILKQGVHKFDMFYAETAGASANCRLRFNLLADDNFITTTSEPPYNLLFVNYQYNSDVAEIYREMSGYTGQVLELTRDIAKDFEFETLPFAGWFKTREAAASGYVYNNTMQHVDLLYAYPHNVILTNYPKGDVTLPVMVNGTKQNVTYQNAIVFYAGWIPEVSQQKAAADTNQYGTTTVGAFDLAGVQIRGSDVDDKYQNPIRNRTTDALRFVTSYSLSFLDEIKSLSRANGGSTVQPEYGYFAVSDLNGNIFNKGGHTINSQGGSIKVNCTKTGDQNHHYYSGYLLSTLVIKYDDHPEYKDVPVEARAYIYYKDANGNMRYNDDTYGTETGETTFWGGCRTSFNAAYQALLQQTDTMHYV